MKNGPSPMSFHDIIDYNHDYSLANNMAGVHRTSGRFTSARGPTLVSRGGSNEEAFEGFSWGEVVQGGAGAFTRVLRRWRSGRAGAGVPGCPWGGTPGSVRLCSRCCLVAMGCGDRRSRPACRWPRYRAAWPVHLATLVPGQGAFHQIGQPVDVVDQRVAHPGGVFALGQGQDRHEPGGAPPPG